MLVLAVVASGAAPLEPWRVRFEAPWFSSLVLLLAAGSLLWRVRRPEAVFALCVAANTLHLLVVRNPDSTTGLSTYVAAYALAAHGRPPTRWLLAVVGAAPLAWGFSGVLGSPAIALVASAAVIGVPWLVGDSVRSRRQRVRVEHDLVAARAVADERTRIARDLHDVVAHHVSVVGAQAGAARLTLDADPEGARRALRTIEETSRHALEEMRHMLGALRAERTPGLEDLVAHFRDAGLPVRLEVDSPVPAALDATAYRVVEQALSNVLEHAGLVPTSVVVRSAGSGVDIVVENDGPAVVSVGSGRGVVGMRERVALLSGTLDAGPRPGGGYRVHAHLPGGGS